MLNFAPVLSSLESLNSHRSTLESFGKKLDEKTKSLRAAELLFACKKADWDEVGELASEFRANSDRVVILTEGLCESLFRAVASTCGSHLASQADLRIDFVSSSLNAESLGQLASSLVGQKVSLVLAFQNNPSERLVWSFRALLAALAKGRHPDEVKRRVVVSTGQPASEWERWAQSSSFRTLSFHHRCAGRYLFFSQPTAFLLHLLGQTAWSYVEGGRSFYRQFDKITEVEDPMFAYAALREVQLAEHYRETLVLPDETYSGFGMWWRLLTEESRKLFSEESNDGLVWMGQVMKETASQGRLHWVTEIAVESEAELEVWSTENEDCPPLSASELTTWAELENRYQSMLAEHRQESVYAQPSVRIALRRKDPFCLGALFCFFEVVASVSHKLAESSDNFSLYSPHSIAGAGV